MPPLFAVPSSFFFLLAVLCLSSSAACAGEPEPSPASSSSAPSGADVQRLKTRVIESHPHDPGAFTQGLLWADGELYESTGLYGRSSLRRVDPVTGRVEERRDLDPGYFGEGLALVGDRLVQLTWKAGVALVWDRATLELVDQWGFNGEGWGLTFDGRHFIVSDGSSRLTFHDSKDFSWVRTLEVTQAGRPLERLNELEWVDGKIFANLWGEETIVRIDPTTGAVDATVDASGLLSAAEARMVDVLNGIAYAPETGRFWITGKFWPRIFEVELVDATQTAPPPRQPRR